MSVRASTSWPRACSGDMYAAVPTTIPASVFNTVRVVSAPASSGAVGASLASPKSSTFTKPSGRSMTFSGLMSRWTMPDGVRGAQRGSNLDRDVECLADRQPCRGEPLPERLALDVLHRDVVLAVAGLAERVDRADVRVIEGGCGSRLLLEALDARAGRG